MTVLKFNKPVETYEGDIFCPNCNHFFKIIVQKGKLVREQEQDEECPKCGCTARQFQMYLMSNAVRVPIGPNGKLVSK